MVIVGDSGAGKSETLEAFRELADEYISDMTIIFDDMGSLQLSPAGLLGYGTEIGAFVRLDDLSPGYAFGHFDRSIFMNPDRGNARVVVPLTEYRDVVAGYPVDLLLYANNYEHVTEDAPVVEFFADARRRRWTSSAPATAPPRAPPTSAGWCAPTSPTPSGPTSCATCTSRWRASTSRAPSSAA